MIAWLGLGQDQSRDVSYLSLLSGDMFWHFLMLHKHAMPSLLGWAIEYKSKRYWYCLAPSNLPLAFLAEVTEIRVPSKHSEYQMTDVYRAAQIGEWEMNV